MSPSASGTIKSFSFAKSCQAVRTKAMASKSRGWQVCQRKFSTGPRKFLRIWSVDRKSTRLNSSHLGISYAVFCLKKKKKQTPSQPQRKSSKTKQTTKKEG